MTGEEAASIVRRYFDAWNRGDTGSFDELVHADFEEPWAPPPGYGTGPAGARGSYAANLARFSAIRFDVEDVVTEPDAVACRTTFHFTDRKTGAPGRMVGMNIFRLKAGKLHREWYVYVRVT